MTSGDATGKRALGASGSSVFPIGFGCMSLSGVYGASDDHAGIELVHEALDRGVTLLDTSDMYGAIAGRRASVVLATKFGDLGGRGGKIADGRPEYVAQACAASLKRLGVEIIDLYYQHRIDPDVPVEDTVGAMARLVAQGKVRALGLSEARPETIRRAHQVHPIAAVQNEYSLLYRSEAEETLRMTRALGIAFVAYAPLGRGLLTAPLYLTVQPNCSEVPTPMDFSTMILTMYIAAVDSPDNDERVLGIAIEQSLLAGELGYNPWFTEHHFRGAWHSNPMQFAAFVAPQIPRERYVGFGVLSTPYYNPVRLVESMNLLDQLTKGRTLYGLGSGFPGNEPAGLGVEKQYHGSGQSARDTLDIMERLWDFRTGDPEYVYEIPTHRGTIRRRVTPAPYRKHHPTIIRTASRDAAVVTAARNGWPAFLGTFGSDSSLLDQTRLYRHALAEAKHPQEVVDECLHWCTCDWLSVVVAETDAEAQSRAEEAKAEFHTTHARYAALHGALEGPAVKPKPGQTLVDMFGTIAGNPDTVAAKVQELVDIGINHLLVRFIGDWTGTTRPIAETSMRLFAREVMPRFQHIAPLRDPLALDLGAVSQVPVE